MSEPVPVPITPPSGVVKTETSRVIEGRWIDSDKVRFVNGRPQKIGGWTQQSTVATSGLPRTMHCWRDLVANNFIAIGTYRKLYAYDPNITQYDITPFRITGSLATDPFSTVSGSPIVTVSHTGHGLTAGDTIIIAGSGSVGGLTMNGTWIVTAVTNSGVYTFTNTSNATSTTTGGGGSVTFQYEIPIGTELAASGLGWGVGGWGLGTWGDPKSSSTIVIEPRVWSLDHFGKILLASYNSGSIYTFDPTVAQPWPRAALIAASPSDCRAMFITPERFVFALRENMVVSSCSQGNYNDWTPSSSNTAFSRTLTEGSRLVAGRVLAPFVSLVWSDAAVYIFQYTGSQFVYNSSLVGTSCGLIGPNAVVTVQGTAYWMGPDNLWMFNGSVTQIPNAEDIRHYLFSSLPNNTAFQCFAVFNPTFNEIYFGHANGDATYPTRYVIYNIKDQSWAPGSNTRVSGAHFSQGDTRPYFADANGQIYLHEDGHNDNLNPLPWSLTMAPMAMQEGYYTSEIEAILFDFFEQSGDISVTLNAYDRLTDTVLMDTETETVVQGASPYTEFRLSGRYIGMVLSQTGLNTYFRFGKPAAFVRRAGTRS